MRLFTKSLFDMPSNRRNGIRVARGESRYERLVAALALAPRFSRQGRLLILLFIPNQLTRVARQVWASAGWPRDRSASRIRDAVAKLADYIAAADKQGLQGEPFRNGVGQMLALAKKEATGGPPLPFGPMVVGSPT